MKKTLCLIIIGIFIAGCADDIIVRPASELRGAYEGYYTRIKSVSSGASSKYQNIEWTFTDQKFFCEVTDTEDVWLCDFSGNYELADKLILSDTVVAAQTCDRSDIPVGSFQLIRKSNPSGPDSLVIEQYDQDADVKKIIRIVKTD